MLLRSPAAAQSAAAGAVGAGSGGRNAALTPSPPKAARAPPRPSPVRTSKATPAPCMRSATRSQVSGPTGARNLALSMLGAAPSRSRSAGCASSACSTSDSRHDAGQQRPAGKVAGEGGVVGRDVEVGFGRDFGAAAASGRALAAPGRRPTPAARSGAAPHGELAGGLARQRRHVDDAARHEGRLQMRAQRRDDLARAKAPAPRRRPPAARRRRRPRRAARRRRPRRRRCG